MIHSKRWIGAGALLLAAAGFVSLGRWQLERAAENRAIEDSFRLAAELPEIGRPVSAREAETLRYRRIRLQGRYAGAKQILLDNMTSHGQAGYEILTPLSVAGDGFVLVNRGWVPASPDRNRLPDVAIASDAVEVTGRIGRLPRAALSLGPAAPPGHGPLPVLSFPDFAGIEAVLGHEVYPFVVLLDPEADSGYVREWSPDGIRAERNIAYAVQWFGLAALAFVLAIGTGLRARRRATEAGA